MKVAIHCEPCQGSLGGAELSVAILAHALGAAHDVRILHHRSGLTGNELGAMAGVDLSRTDTVYLPWPSEDAWSCSAASNPLVRYPRARAWQAELSRHMDVFITFTHGVPPFCHARLGILHVLFPFFDRRTNWPWTDEGSTPAWKRLGRRAYYEWEWKRRMNSYQAKVANSAFTRDWTRRRWGVDTSIVYPPVDTQFSSARKANLIVSVGRFATRGVNKRQLELVTLFGRVGASLPAWTYVSAGSLGNSDDDVAYFDRVRHAAPRACRLEPNLSRAELRRMLGSAKIFWHAAGFGEPEGQHPELSEHFGMATVEAMAAGVIPIVADTGGQREIVTHGVDGFLWNTPEECENYTIRIARDDALRLRMSARARSRAEAFTTSIFTRKVEEIIHSIDRGAHARSAPTVSQSVTPTH